ncbi:uncharacterized protein JCM10292_007093 [Rhodotorula paludigena]|uniref:uncharacterized protein n=1 Tax=Rhodotorula paludigena TaxID=86838 RepID=UPI0031759829
MQPPRDPNHRRDAFHTAPLLAAHDSQHARRQAALAAQKQRRVHAIEAARSSFRVLDFMEDLSLAASDDDGDDDDRPPPCLLAAGTPAPAQTPAPGIAKVKRKAFKPKFKAWAKNLLSHAETLDLRHGLPEGLESDWRAVAVPRGKRCLCATTADQPGGNTILYSRVAGRTLGRFRTLLPPDCLLDAIWDAELGVLWVLDLCKWRSTYFVECEAEMRAFFLTSKLSELPAQPYLPPTSPFASHSPPGTTRTLLVLAAPALDAPLAPFPSRLAPWLDSLFLPRPSMRVGVLAPRESAAGAGGLAFERAEVDVPLRGAEGVLLYLLGAHYESGATPLLPDDPSGALRA